MRLFGLVLTLLLTLPALSAASMPASGTWRSAPDETPLSSSFDEAVWGKNAKAIRTVEMAIQPGGDAALTVNYRVLDERGRAIPGSTSIERVDLTLGPAAKSSGVRADLAVAIKRAERRYPDDPGTTWPLDGLRVTVTTFTDNADAIEVRLDFPEGRGSFWATLRRSSQKR